MIIWRRKLNNKGVAKTQERPEVRKDILSQYILTFKGWGVSSYQNNWMIWTKGPSRSFPSSDPCIDNSKVRFHKVLNKYAGYVLHYLAEENARIQHQCPVLYTGWQRSYWYKLDLVVRIQATEIHGSCLYCYSWKQLCLCWMMQSDTWSNTLIVFDFWWCLEPYHTGSQFSLKTYIETAHGMY